MAGRRAVGLAEVGAGDLDEEHALAPVTDHVELLRTADRSSHRLAVSAALAGHDGSHLSPCASTVVDRRAAGPPRRAKLTELATRPQPDRT
jgi:hypothetical protein